jgi:hypothetical protein
MQRLCSSSQGVLLHQLFSISPVQAAAAKKRGHEPRAKQGDETRVLTWKDNHLAYEKSKEPALPGTSKREKGLSTKQSLECGSFLKRIDTYTSLSLVSEAKKT